MPPDSDCRYRFLCAVVAGGVAVCLLTEFLGSLHLLGRTSLAVAWGVLAAAGAVWAVYRRLGPGTFAPKFDGVLWLSIAGIAVVLSVTFATALLSPPNSADAMAYHLPRVLYWAEQGSVRFFPTPYLNQIMLQPMAEYVMLHTYLISGGDRLINLVAWFASFGCVAGVSGIARQFGAGARGQAMAALFCATIPGGILASSGAKNDYLMALWLVCAVYFALRFAAKLQTADACWFGCALGLALLTKATAYLFAPFLLAAVLAAAVRSWKRIALAAACALIINAPQYARNIDLSGSPLGFDSAQGNGVFRWRNEFFGWKPTVSNMLRNASDQMGARSDAWNRAVFDFVAGAHRRLGMATDDPATTWRGGAFGPPVNANHEANAPNRWHLAILLGAACVIFWRAARGKDGRRALYALGLACGFAAFCSYLKWQPFGARLLLPLFVLGAPLAAMAEEIPSVYLQAALCVFLLNNARPAAFENWIRPLKGPGSIARHSRDEMYFSDMGQWNNAASYPAAVRWLRASRCGVVGIDINNLQLEYPLQALLRHAVPDVRFVHTGVENASRRYSPPVAAAPCAIACLDCLNDTTRLQRYGDFPQRATAGKFVILWR